MKDIYDICSQIREHDLISYVQSNGLNVSRPGDRCTSIAPGEHTHDNAFCIESNEWFDHTLGKGGDIIEFERWFNCNGDRPAAIRSLAQKFGINCNDEEISQYSRTREELKEKITYWHSQLRPEDKEYLHSRRINDETIEKLKIGYSEKRMRLIIPYFMNGEPVYWAGRDRSPEGYVDQQTGKKPAKYIKMAITDSFTENIPWGFDTLGVKDKTPVETSKGVIVKDDYLIIAEGMFDIMSFFQEGYRCLSPISGFFNKKFMPQVLSVCRSVKCVILCFDSDLAGQAFTRKMGAFLMANHVNFRAAVLPEGIKDISDYYAPGGNLDELVAGSVDGLHVMNSMLAENSEARQDLAVEMAESIKSPSEFKYTLLETGAQLGKDFAVTLCNEAVKNGHVDKAYVKDCKSSVIKGPSEQDCVEAVLEDHELIYSEGIGFYEYIHGRWKLQSKKRIEQYIYEYLGEYASNQRVKNAAQLLSVKCFTECEFNKKNIINFKNGTLDLGTLAMQEHSPDDLSTIQMSYDYDPQAKCPKWEKFIYEVMSGNAGKIRLLRQALGYLLYADNKLQRAVVFMGNGSNGKGVIISVIKALFSKENCSSVEISNLSQNFMAIQLKDKMVNLCSEVNTEFKNAEIMFKKIVTDDPIYDSYKGKDGITFTTRCKTIISANDYIYGTRINYAILRRMLFIKFARKFEGKNMNVNLTDELLEELPGIFNWVLEGYKDLMKEGGFTETDEHRDTMKDYLRTASPVDEFIEEYAHTFRGSQMTTKELYATYKGWCMETGNHSHSQGRFVNIFKNNLELHGLTADIRNIYNKEIWTFADNIPAPEPPAPAPVPEPAPAPEPPAPAPASEPSVSQVEIETRALFDDGYVNRTGGFMHSKVAPSIVSVRKNTAKPELLPSKWTDSRTGRIYTDLATVEHLLPENRLLTARLIVKKIIRTLFTHEGYAVFSKHEAYRAVDAYRKSMSKHR